MPFVNSFFNLIVCLPKKGELGSHMQIVFLHSGERDHVAALI